MLEVPGPVGNDPPHERKAVAVHARAGKAENDVAGCDSRAGQHLVALDRADAEAGEIIVAGRVHARHFGGFAADQRAAGLPAALGDRRDDRRGDVIVELPGGIIIEEEQRLGALNDEIVGAHRDQIDADAVMTSGLDRELELGADAVVRGDQQGIAIARRLEIEEAAKAASSASAPGRAVERASGPMAFTSALPASIETPASA